MDTRWIQLATDLTRAATSPEALREAIAALAPPEEFAPLIHELATLATAHEDSTAHLMHLANTDDLTGLHNRRAFGPGVDTRLLLASKQAALANDAPGVHFRATLLLFDIDNFKQYNDIHSHAVGDEILHSIAKLLQATTREQDVLGRIGGDEFAVLFWDLRPRDPSSAPLEEIGVIAERFRAAVECSSLPALGSSGEGQLTISGGLAVYPKDGTTAEELLASADKALAEAKASGKNSILLISNPTEAL